MTIIAPGSSLVCKIGGSCWCGCSKVTEGSIYLCEHIDLQPIEHMVCCNLKDCVCVTIWVKDKAHGFCSERFKSLNDGDTSLVEKTAEEVQGQTDKWIKEHTHA